MPIRSFERGQQVERDQLAGHPLGLFRAEPEGQRRAIDLDQGVADRLARLQRDEPADLLATGSQPGADLAQDPAAFVGRQVTRHLEGRDCGLDRLLVLGLGGVVGAPGGGRRIGRVLDDEDVGRVDPAAGEEDRMRLGPGGDGHLREAPLGTLPSYRPASACPAAGGVPWPGRPSPGSAPGQARLADPACQAGPGRHVRLRQGVGRATARAPVRTARVAPGPALGGGEAFGPRRPPGDRRGRQGRHHPEGHGGVQPPGLRRLGLQGPDPRGAGPRLPVADPQAGPGQGRDRHLQPLALRGRPGRPGPWPRAAQGLVGAL